MRRLPGLLFLPTLVVGWRGAGAEPVASAPRWEQPPERLAAIKMFNAWKPPVPPRRLLGSIHYVGTSGIAAYLITTPAGLEALGEKSQQLQTHTGSNPFLNGESGWKAQLTNAERAFREQLAAEERAVGKSSFIRPAPSSVGTPL